MGTISAQISVYPLRRQSIAKVIEGALNALRTYDVEVNTGSMSTEMVGEEIEVFSALRASFRAACAVGDAVMVMTVSNACPLEPAADQTAREG
ncbi:MAG: Ykof family thiamine-binding protein [Thermoanaerobaculales bacterium]|nr:Ykof family thiamine-binding protein [Thermoanaerobaculales bacterium]